MLGAVFEKFVEKSPISVMVRASLERVLGADRLDLWYERTAQKQYTRDLLFSSVYDLMNQVVFCVQPSVRAAYQAHQNDVGTSLVSVYNKLNGLETHTAAELVRYSAREFAPLIQHMGGERAPWLEGYRVKIVDGNCLEASEHRIKELRDATGRALPGKSLVVYEPALGVVTDVFPCENGHAQERSLFGAVLDTVEAGALWIEDRNCCTRAFLCEIDQRGAFCVTREHQGGRISQLGEDGHSSEKAVCFWHSSPRMPKETLAQCYASMTAYGMMIPRCNSGSVGSKRPAH
jgi:hypothetical protein